MPPAPSKTLSPAELAKLEHAFATDPASESYKPLAEAYLSMGRFMEAMVVCKKGVKAHPDRPDPRVLLARVYAEQGKDKKALEELNGALTAAPNDKAALRLAGSLQLKNGEPDTGRLNLLKAYEQDPNDSDTLNALAQHNIQVAKPAPPPPPEPVAAPPVIMAAPATAAPSVNGTAVASAPAVVAAAQPSSQPRAQQAQPAPQKVNGAAARTSTTAARPVVRRPVERYEEEEDDDEVSVPRGRAAKKSGASKYAFLFLAPALVLGLGAYAYLGHRKAVITRESNKGLTNARAQLKRDSYDGYIAATKEAEKVLDLDSDNGKAEAILAYAWVIRWGEHGGGDEARQAAEQHLEAAKKSGEESSELYAAQALYTAYSGKLPQAKQELEDRVKQFEAEGKAAGQLYLTLGLIQMNAGDLQRAKESLDKAQTLAGSDPRVYSGLANVYARMGQDSQALQNFVTALRYEKGHPESMLGSVLLELDKDDPDYGQTAAILKRLLEQEPPPSPRQLATAHFARALLVSRVSRDLPLYKPEYQKQLTDATGVTADKAKSAAEIQKEEQAGLTLDKNNPELNLLKAKRLLYEEKYDEAATAIKQAIAVDPSRAQFYVELAKALMQKQGGEKEAAEALEKALKTMGDSPKLMTMLGQAYMKMGKLDEAIAQFTKATEGKNKNPEARLALGVALREKKQFDKASGELEKASQEFVGNSAKVAEVYGELGLVYENKGDKAKAQDAYTKALNADASVAEPYYYFARFVAASGDRKSASQAQELAKKYLELEPKGRYASDAAKLAGR